MKTSNLFLIALAGVAAAACFYFNIEVIGVALVASFLVGFMLMMFDMVKSIKDNHTEIVKDVDEMDDYIAQIDEKLDNQLQELYLTIGQIAKIQIVNNNPEGDE